MQGIELAMSPHVAVTTTPTEGVAMFARCPPVHTVILGQSRVAIAGGVQSSKVFVAPAGTPHTVLAFGESHASVAYLDPRRFHFAEVERLAQRWARFVPGQDDLRELVGETLTSPPRRLDGRLVKALDLLAGGADVASTAIGVGLSESRLTHAISDSLGSPPRQWRAWFKLRRAIGEAVLHRRTLTEAAHAAGFTDSAHLTRTCKNLMGVAPARVLPRVVHVLP